MAQHSSHFDPSAPWENLECKTREETRLFRLLKVLRRSPHTGRIHDFTRLECPDWINVIAFTPMAEGGELLVVEQFRHGVDRATLEVIGGVSEEGEAPLDAAKRELLEETGHASEEWINLGWCTPNPAIQNNRCHFFLAKDCRKVSELQLDPGEELRVWAFGWKEWQAKIQQGEIHHALVMGAFYCLSQWSGWEEFRRQLEYSGDCVLEE